MKYMGSKSRQAKYILPIILGGRKDGQLYIEPFCGGCNVIDKVANPRLASDSNKYLIAFLKGLSSGRVGDYPISKELYVQARDEWRGIVPQKMDDFTLGWIGFMASYNGRFFDGGYSGNYKKRDYIGESIKNVLNQIKPLEGVFFHYGDYRELPIPDDSIVYCDPPYNNTKQYSQSFNHDEFWDWVRNISENNKVYVSEQTAPSDFKCIWEQPVKRTMRPNITKKATEKLFIYNPDNIL